MTHHNQSALRGLINELLNGDEELPRGEAMRRLETSLQELIEAEPPGSAPAATNAAPTGSPAGTEPAPNGARHPGRHLGADHPQAPRAHSSPRCSSHAAGSTKRCGRSSPRPGSAGSRPAGSYPDQSVGQRDRDLPLDGVSDLRRDRRIRLGVLARRLDDNDAWYPYLWLDATYLDVRISADASCPRP